VTARDALADVGTALATWRRRMTERTTAWIGGGASFASSDRPDGGPRQLDFSPYAETGFSRAGGEGEVGVLASVRVTPLVDRFTGTPSNALDGLFTLDWPVATRTTLAALGFAGAGLAGHTAVAGAEVRVAFEWKERLVLEGGVRGRWQREDRPVAPSFMEGGVFAAITWTTRRLEARTD
jgi:hypothetical protein